MLYGSDVAIQPATISSSGATRASSQIFASRVAGRGVKDPREVTARSRPLDDAWLLDRQRHGHQRGEEDRQREERGQAHRRAHRRQQLRERPGGASPLAGRDHFEARGAQSRPASMMRARNSRVRGSVGLLKICSGGPSSQMTPTSRKQTLSATLARERHLVGGD